MASPLTRSLLLSEIFPPKTGGSGRWFWEIYRRLEPTQVFVCSDVCDVVDAPTPISDAVRIERFPLHLASWGICRPGEFRAYWNRIRQVRQLVKRERISVIHAGRCLPEGVMALALKWTMRIPYVCYVHGEDVNTAWASRELTFLVRRVLTNAMFCVANSRNTASLLSQDWKVPPHNVRLLHPGVDTSFFTPAPTSEAARAELGWRGRKVVLTVGRLQRRKGHDMLIRALPTIRQSVGNVLYAIIGDGDDRATLERLVDECGVCEHVALMGEVDDHTLLTAYQQCDVFALPNREIDGDIEGFGMVLLEAQSCGKPVLAGDSGGTAETMQPGVTGSIVDCREPAPLATAITELLQDGDRLIHMGQRARAWVVSQFDWNTLACQAAELFGIELRQSALSGEPASPAAIEQT